MITDQHGFVIRAAEKKHKQLSWWHEEDQLVEIAEGTEGGRL